MKDNYFVGMYWGMRKEAIEDCSIKIRRSLHLLEGIDASFKNWYKTTKPKKGELVMPIDSGEDSIMQLLLKGRNYNDVGVLLENLGYAFMLKSEKDFSKAHVLSFQCGCYFEKIPNAVTLNISKGESYERIADVEVLQNLFQRLSEIWEPERGVISRNSDDILMQLNK